MTVSADLAAYLQASRQQIDAALDAFLPRPPDCPAIVSDAMRYSLFPGGKRFRPILTLAAAEAVAERDAADVAESGPNAVALALPAACAIELIHSYSLIHDDLPAMDDDRLRRGRPTAHMVYGEGIAILAGDALLTQAFSVMARQSDADNPALIERQLRAITLVARAAGAEGMVGGQAIDLAAAGRLVRAFRESESRAALDSEALRAMHARKTGALIRAAAGAGAIMAGVSDRLLQAVDLYAAEIGLAFQIMDDVLDVEGAEVELGKTAGKDTAAGKVTYPAFYGLEQSRQLARDCVARAISVLSAAGLRGRLAEIAEWVVERRS